MKKIVDDLLININSVNINNLGYCGITRKDNGLRKYIVNRFCGGTWQACSLNSRIGTSLIASTFIEFYNNNKADYNFFYFESLSEFCDWLKG